MHLPHSSYDLLLNSLPHLYASQTLPRFFHHAVRVLEGVIQSDGCGWFIHRLGVGAIVAVESTPCMSPASIKRMGEATKAHPFVAHWTRTQEPAVVSDADIEKRVFERHVSEFEEAYREMGVHNLTIPLALSPTEANAFSFRSYRRVFTESDRLMAALLAPHLRQAHANAALLTKAMARMRVSVDITPDTLTGQESKVALWLAQGKTNWEIGQILGISPRTAEKHVEKILLKLHVENRVAAAVILGRSGAGST